MLTTVQFCDFYRQSENWKGITFRAGARETTPFGLDNTFKRLRIHVGRDRAPGGVWAPFEISRAFYRENYLSFGTMLFLYVAGADFVVRIAHIRREDFTRAAWQKIRRRGRLPAGFYLGTAGNAGISTGTGGGFHTHTEIVSMAQRSEICEGLLLEKYSEEDINRDLDEADVVAYAEKVGIPFKEAEVSYYEQRVRKRVAVLNNLLCRRMDYATGEYRTFYNSDILFDM